MKNQRKTFRSGTGKKLYALRDSAGRFKDIRAYQRAHKADLRRRAGKRLEQALSIVVLKYRVRRRGSGLGLSCGIWVGEMEVQSLVQEIMRKVRRHAQP